MSRPILDIFDEILTIFNDFWQHFEILSTVEQS